MKIISKFKDYYDYLVGVWGEDSKLVLDRTDFYTMKLRPHDSCLVRFHIGGWVVDSYYDKVSDDFYWGDDIQKFSSDENRWYYPDGYSKESHYYIEVSRRNVLFIRKSPYYLGDKSPTWRKDSPLLVGFFYNWGGSVDWIKNPVLREWGMGSFVSAETVWLWLSEWLGNRISKSESDGLVGSDSVRIKSAGFDIKKSFRRMDRGE